MDNAGDWEEGEIREEPRGDEDVGLLRTEMRDLDELHGEARELVAEIARLGGSDWTSLHLYGGGGFQVASIAFWY